LKARLDDLGAEAMPMTPAKFAKLIAEGGLSVCALPIKLWRMSPFMAHNRRAERR
jgi:hypothetical protein